MELNLKKKNKIMSHVRRKPSRHPHRVVRRKKKKKKEKPWLAYFIIILLFLSLIVGIILVLFATP